MVILLYAFRQETKLIYKIMIQKPFPGEHLLRFRGDIIEFAFSLGKKAAGRAFIRTNIGNASIQRYEIIRSVKNVGPRSGQDWHDIPMRRKGPSSFSISLALLEEGHFEAKCFYVDDEGSDEPSWINGENVHINVEPSSYCCANSIYCAFVRQFGLNKDQNFSKPIPKLEREEIAELDKEGYTVIPPSGTFRALKKSLTHIVDDLNCRIIHLLPINPTPTVYARMGRYGSPYASLDFTAIDPALAEFDRKATPLDQFLELVDAVHRKNAKLFIDIAINHTGWAAKIHETNPEWLLRESDGAIHSPGAWGVVWGDLTELDHKRTDLWDYLADVFLTWCARGVDGFRCDAGYMIPEKAWEFIIAKVRDQYPSAIFLLEGLGGDPELTKSLLNKANMNWAYSELFQNFSRQEIERYLPYAQNLSLTDGIIVHYAETHDNNRLASISDTYSRMRTALCALASNNGAFGFTNGVEWFAKEKIDVHESSALAWGSKVNQIAHISRLNTILIAHPAFYNGSSLKIIDTGSSSAIAFIREDSTGTNNLLILINLDCENRIEFMWKNTEIISRANTFVDLISEENFVPSAGKFKESITMSPGQALCLSPRIEDLRLIHDIEEKSIIKPDRISMQNAIAMALDILCWRQKSKIIIDIDIAKLANSLLDDVYSFCRNVFEEKSYCPVMEWRWPEDIKRETLIPPGHIILIKAAYNFRARIVENGRILVQRDSLKSRKGYNFVLIPPLQDVDIATLRQIKITVYADDRSRRESGNVVFLPNIIDPFFVDTEFSHEKIAMSDAILLSVNGRGGMCRQPLEWGGLRSRYDCILAGNLNTEHPEDRHIMWTRCRIYTDHHGRKECFSSYNLDNFHIGEDGNSGIWTFKIPLGNGIFTRFIVGLQMIKEKNQTVMNIRRDSKKEGEKNLLDDNIPVKLIIRPDIEDRNFHYETKAYLGLENIWPNNVISSIKSFVFAPSPDRKICISTTKGIFKASTEWSYAIYKQNETDRGLDPYGDLYSPGYFEVTFNGDEEDIIVGTIITSVEPQNENFPHENISMPSPLKKLSFESALLNAMEKFIVKREDWKTVIAGYPWFLDWGRDTLIFARGLISAEKFSEVKKIILLFAKFAENGTIPNMIQGKNASNRDSSDAPLWLFVAVSDFCLASKSDEILNEKVDGQRSLLDTLVGIAHNYIMGTPNGIKMDTDSALIFSPSHFTWMDTNFPAGTPREGYPIEIESLWFAALSFLESKTKIAKWGELKRHLISSVNKYYHLTDPITEDFVWLSDCLHASPGTAAAQAKKDDHLRPNQLLAISLGLIQERELRKGILRACSELLIPGAIRSLADREVHFELPIYNATGALLNNAQRPYFGNYRGAEDVSRKAAYHNGTAWTWLFPSYAEALLLTHGEIARMTAISLLSSSKFILENGCVGNIPEILDGNYPHRQRGCDAQAWGVSELYRVWKIAQRA